MTTHPTGAPRDRGRRGYRGAPGKRLVGVVTADNFPTSLYATALLIGKLPRLSPCQIIDFLRPFKIIAGLFT